MDNVEDAIGFVLFVRNGYISWLEGYTMALDFWSEDYSEVVLNYDEPDGKRDFQYIKKILA